MYNHAADQNIQQQYHQQQPYMQSPQPQYDPQYVQQPSPQPIPMYMNQASPQQQYPPQYQASPQPYPPQSAPIYAPQPGQAQVQADPHADVDRPQPPHEDALVVSAVVTPDENSVRLR